MNMKCKITIKNRLNSNMRASFYLFLLAHEPSKVVLADYNCMWHDKIVSIALAENYSKTHREASNVEVSLCEFEM